MIEQALAELPGIIAGFKEEVPVDLSSKPVQERLSPTAIKAFLRIVDCWKLRDEDARQLLGGVSNGAFYQWKGGRIRRLDQDKLTRISMLVGIFKALNILYSQRLADLWIGLPNSNSVFSGATPLAYMMQGGIPNLLRVRQLLDARRGGR